MCSRDTNGWGQLGKDESEGGVVPQPASESFSHGSHLDNRWPLMLAYAEMCDVSPQKKCNGRGLCDTRGKTQCLYRPPKDSVILF